MKITIDWKTGKTAPQHDALPPYHSHEYYNYSEKNYSVFILITDKIHIYSTFTDKIHIFNFHISHNQSPPVHVLDSCSLTIPNLPLTIAYLQSIDANI